MRVNKGVEWAVHACVMLCGLPTGQSLSRERLAEFHGVPPAYMGKQLQALSRAGLVVSGRGRGGGYRLAKAPTEISLRDIFEAIEGRQPAFQCREIRQNGPCPTPREDCTTPCPIAAAMLAAEQAYRESLASVSVADLAMQVAQSTDPARLNAIMGWVMTP